MKYPMVSIHVADFGGHYPEATHWRQTGFLALIQCYSVLPDFPVDIAADMLKLGQTCQGDFPLTDRDLHARLAQENIQNIFFPLAYLTKGAIAERPALKLLRGNRKLARASKVLVHKFKDQYKKAAEKTAHQLYQAILTAFHRQMQDVLACLEALCNSASSTANGDSSGSEQE